MKLGEKVRMLGSAIFLTMLGVLACAAVVLAKSESFDVYNPTPYGTLLTIVKEWDDSKDQYQKRPDYIEVSYKVTVTYSDKDPEIMTDTVKLEAPDWSTTIRWPWGYPFEIPQSITMEVEEIGVPDGYTAEYSWDQISEDMGLGSGKGCMVTIKNTYTPPPAGDLSVKKIVSGEGADQEKEFEFTLNLTDSRGVPLEEEYPYMITTDESPVSEGVISDGGRFSLTHGQSFIVNGLPVGTEYSVKETETEDYKLESLPENAEGIISEDEAVVNVEFNNVYVPPKTSVTVKKEWNDNNDPERPGEILVQLYRKADGEGNSWESYGDPQTLNASMNWTYTWSELPKAGYTYTVKELRPAEEGENPEITIDSNGYMAADEGELVNADEQLYQVSYSEMTTDPSGDGQSITIVNQALWRLIKRSSSGTEENPVYLSGAEFTLTLSTDSGTELVYTGRSAEDGTVEWMKDGQPFTETFPDGNYTLKETKAPDGYIPGNEIKFQIISGVPAGMGTGNTGTWKEGVLTFYYDNAPAYKLPSTGGTGIYPYIVSGMLLLAVGTVMIIRKRRTQRYEDI